MLRGIYTGASGMKAQLHNMDAISNNLANVDVTGYKRDTAVHKAFPEMMIRRTNDNGVYKFPFGSVDTMPIVGKLGTGVEFNELFTNFEQGAVKETENPFDLALEGEGFFSVQTPDGERYTRNGTFTIEKSGVLVTQDGFPVLGENGPITLKKNNFIVDAQGRIFQNDRFADDPDRLVSMEENEWEDSELVDTFKISDFARTRYLKKQGNSFWIDTEESGAAVGVELGAETKIRQGFLETSNVNTVQEMVRMIEINRAYEANQKVISSHDSMADSFINDAMKV